MAETPAKAHCGAEQGEGVPRILRSRVDLLSTQRRQADMAVPGIDMNASAAVSLGSVSTCCMALDVINENDI